MLKNLIFFLFFGVLLCACSTTKGNYDDFFNEKSGWIPANENISKEEIK